MNNLTHNEILVLVWLAKKISTDFSLYKIVNDSELIQIRKKWILNTIKTTNEENDGLLEAVFITNFQSDGFQWMDVVEPDLFKRSLEKYITNLRGFLKMK